MAEIDNQSKKEQKEMTKDDRLDKLLWFKIYSSCAFGILFGALNFTGFFIFVLFFICHTVLSFLYFSKFITNEDVDYQTEIFTDGLNLSIPLFLLLWVLSYTFTVG